MEGYSKNPYYQYLEEHRVFLLALKWNLYEEAFFFVKTKSNSHFAVIFVERSSLLFAVDCFDINRYIRKMLNKSCRFDHSFWFFGNDWLIWIILFVIFILQLSSDTKLSVLQWSKFKVSSKWQTLFIKPWSPFH